MSTREKIAALGARQRTHRFSFKMVVVTLVLVGALGSFAAAGHLAGAEAIATVLPAGLALAFAAWALLKARKRVVVYEEGLVAHGFGGPPAVFGWHEIDYFWHHINEIHTDLGKQVHHRWTIQRDDEDDRQLVFDSHLSGIVDLGKTIDREVAPRLAARLMARLQAGETLDCGALVLTPQGIVHDDRLLEWNDVGGVKTISTAITVSHAGDEWCRVDAGHVPSAPAVVALGKRLAGRGVTSAA